MLANPNPGLYIHIPFCLRKCPYCDFYSTADLSLKPAFLKALLLEIRLTAGPACTFDTVYLGGGTPSLLDTGDIQQIIDAINEYHSILPDAEFTIEANPGTVRPRQLSALRDVGVNRINIGVQSFQSRFLRFLGRIHTAGDSDRAVQSARDAGFENIGLDLIYGLPGQSKADLAEDLRRAVAFRPAHLSCYTLTYEPETPMGRQRQAGRIRPMPDGRLADLMIVTAEYLGANGYERYEISNYARSEPSEHQLNRSKHNQKYWNHVPYLGLGPSAHSYAPPVRRWNMRDVGKYIDRLADGQLPVGGKEQLSRRQEMTESIYLGFRQADGIILDRFNQAFECDFLQEFSDPLVFLKSEGLLMVDETACRLTEKGMRLLDSVVERFLILDF